MGEHLDISDIDMWKLDQLVQNELIPHKDYKLCGMQGNNSIHND